MLLARRLVSTATTPGALEILVASAWSGSALSLPDGLFILEGTVDLIAGAVALFFPGLTVLAFVFLTAAWALVSGGIMFAASFRLNHNHGRWWLAVGGIASMILGLLLAIAPVISAVVLTWWMSAYALVFGVTQLVLAYKLRKRRIESQHIGLIV
jgi:uncharacterized membrane protein HdeD (DUF308 family)